MNTLRIRELRNEFNLTQEELGKKIGQTKSNVSKYETGALEPGIDTLTKIADIFNVSLDYLTNESDIRNPYNIDKFKVENVHYTDEQLKELGLIENPNSKWITDRYIRLTEVEKAMKIILEQPGLMLKGELLSDESKIILANAIQMGLRTAEELEKKRNKGDNNE